MARIDAEMKSFMEADVDTMIATRDAGLRPHVGRCWGTRVAENGDSVEVFVDRPHSSDVLSDLRENGIIAIAWSQPSTHKTIQFKGRCIEMGDPGPEDFAWIDRHHKLFSDALSVAGFARELTRAMWSNNVVRVRLILEHAFDQSPGPGAGRQI